MAAIRYAHQRPDKYTATNLADCATVERRPNNIGTTPGKQTEMQAMPLLNPNMNADIKSIFFLFLVVCWKSLREKSYNSLQIISNHFC
jgi:hypothetical protein